MPGLSYPGNSSSEALFLRPSWSILIFRHNLSTIGLTRHLTFSKEVSLIVIVNLCSVLILLCFYFFSVGKKKNGEFLRTAVKRRTRTLIKGYISKYPFRGNKYPHTLVDIVCIHCELEDSSVANYV